MKTSSVTWWNTYVRLVPQNSAFQTAFHVLPALYGPVPGKDTGNFNVCPWKWTPPPLQKFKLKPDCFHWNVNLICVTSTCKTKSGLTFNVLIFVTLTLPASFSCCNNVTIPPWQKISAGSQKTILWMFCESTNFLPQHPIVLVGLLRHSTHDAILWRNRRI